MSKELERLKSIRAQLEEESHSLTEQQKNLEERVQVLGEKIAIEEQKNRNKEMREAISQLESKINELEQRLKTVSKAPEPNGSTFEAKPEPEPAAAQEQVTLESVEQASEEVEEETVTVAPLEEPMLEEDYSETIKKPHEKKKRKFF
jgi:type II secretory pathway component PulJ